MDQCLYWLQMIRRFWIGFYAFALTILGLVTVAVEWLIIIAFFIPQVVAGVDLAASNALASCLVAVGHVALA